jgi:hypothetical protein
VTRGRRKAIQCTKMTDLLAKLCVCDFEDNLPSVSQLYASGCPYRHVIVLIGSVTFGHGRNNATHVATWFRTLFSLSPRLTEGHHSGSHLSQVRAVQIPLAVPPHPIFKQREERDLDSNNHVRSPPSTYTWEAYDPSQLGFTATWSDRYVLPWPSNCYSAGL